MIRSFTKRLKAAALNGIIICLAAAGAHQTHAQVGNTGSFLQGSLDDASILTAEYIRPYAEGFGAVANTGWVYKAGTHSVLGFDLSLRFGAAAVPSGKNQFNLNELGLSSIRPINPASSVTPSVSGSNSAGPQVEVFQPNPVTGEDFVITSFNMPSGSGFGYALAPMVQASVGLPYDTDIMLRLVPSVSIPGYGDFGLFGLGFNHELNQWIPGYLPVDLTVMAAFMNIGLTGSFTLAPSPSDYDSDPNNLDTPVRWAGQQAGLSSNSWNANLMAGRSLGPLSVFGGLGFQSTSMEIDFTGEYPVYELAVNQQGDVEVVLDSITDPLTVNVDTGATFRTFAGATVKLGFFYFSAEVTYAEYAVLNAGLGFSFR
ncbi:MAG: hypothetical protein LAT84_11855 [Balneolia bacterium]|nr:hypothetical protein [Balneolia bacterium]